MRAYDFIPSLLLKVSVHVALKIELSEEHSLASLAPETLDSLMNFQVLIQISPLRKRKPTVVLGTLVGSLAGVDTQVVEEVVPFTEGLPALGIRAEQHLNYPLAPWVLQLEDHEFVGARHFSQPDLLRQLRRVELTPWLHFYLEISRRYLGTPAWLALDVFEEAKLLLDN